MFKSLEELFSCLLVHKDTVNLASFVIIPAYLAKGLEFEAVIVFQNEESFYSMEDKNLFYVSGTRAQHELIVYSSFVF